MEIEELLAMLGLNLPQVLLVNAGAEWIKVEIQRAGVWERVKAFAWCLPFAAAAGVCLLAGESLAGTVRCGAMYGLAAIALHEFHGGFFKG